MIDWESANVEILLNPRLPLQEKERALALIKPFEGLESHIWIGTSGSTGTLKWVALSKEAILASAKAVNEHLQSTDRDRWIHPLPDFHVGGIGIWARAYMSGASVFQNCKSGKWDALQFYRLAEDVQATLTALVPAQVHDLVTHQLTAPKSLRAVIVGGGSLQEELYKKAVGLGWKLLPSYGMTECASQVATACLDSCQESGMPELVPLSHLQISINSQGLICIKGASLLTGYAIETEQGPQFIDPKNDGWLQTEDIGQLREGRLIVLGRSGDFVKIGGESVDLQRLDRIIYNIKAELRINADMALIAMPDERLGHVIHLATTVPLGELSDLVDRYSEQVFPFERIREVHMVSDIPRTDLYKLKRNALIQKLDRGDRTCYKLDILY